MHVRRWSREISTFQYYPLPPIATKACFYISFCEICSHTENWEEKQKMPICESQVSGYRLRLWRVLGYDYDQIFGSTDKKLTLFLQYDGNMLFGQSCKLSQEKGQKTWELELIDGLSLTRFLFKKKLFSFSVSIFEYFRKNGRDFLFNPAAGNGFFGLK